MIYAVLIMHLCLVWLNYSVSKSWLYPPVVFTLLWSVILFLLILSGDFFYPISAPTLLIFFLGSLAFSVGGIVSLASRFRVPRISISHSQWTGRVLDAVLLLLLAMFPFYIQRLRELSAMSGFNDFWVGLRYQTASGVRDSGFGLFTYITMLGNLATLAALAQSMKSAYSNWKTCLILTITFIYGMLSTARIGTIILVFSISCVLALNKRLRLKNVLIVTVTFLCVFTVPAYLLGKGMNKNASFSENVVSVRKNMQIYFLGGPVAFDQSTHTPDQISSRGRSFLFFLRLFKALGLSKASNLPNPILPYSFTPTLTNVYTIYFYYYSDFGWTGVIAAMFVLGIIMSRFYGAATAGHPVYVVLYSLGFSMLIISLATEGFLISLSVWIQATLFAFVLYKIPPLTPFNRSDKVSIPQISLTPWVPRKLH